MLRALNLCEMMNVFFFLLSLIIIDVVDVCLFPYSVLGKSIPNANWNFFCFCFLPIASNHRNISLEPYIVNIAPK